MTRTLYRLASYLVFDKIVWWIFNYLSAPESDLLPVPAISFHDRNANGLLEELFIDVFTDVLHAHAVFAMRGSKR